MVCFFKVMVDVALWFEGGGWNEARVLAAT